MNALLPSPWLFKFLRDFERFRPTAYLPTPRDVPTIGFGHTRGVKMGDTCTLDQAEAWLALDCHRDVVAINEMVRVPLTQNQFDALCSLTFNCGITPLEKTLGHLLNAGDYAGAAEQFLRWGRQHGRKLPGLDIRRKAEHDHFLLAA